MKGEKGKVVTLRKEDPRVSDNIGRRETNKQEAVVALKRAASDVTPKLEKLMDIPQRLFIAERVGTTSFSSEEDRGIEQLATTLVLEGAESKDLPMDFADYGIALVTQGSNTYCAFADRKRRIIAFGHIGSMHSEGSWSDFEDALEESIGMAKKLEKNKISFSFVINGRKME